MQKRIQNKVAESRYALPVTTAYAIAIWLAGGELLPSVPFTSDGLFRGAWVQFVCFLVSAYLMIELNNSNALIRIYSRMVSCSFLVICCAACFLFSSMDGAIAQLCFIAAYFMFFRSYQDKTAVGWIFYTFLFIGLGSIAKVHLLYFVPILWISMFIHLTALSWRTFAASLIGLLTPYWFALPFVLYNNAVEQAINHFSALLEFQLPFNLKILSANQLIFMVFVIALAITGIIHYERKRINDNIRIRLLYSFFITMDLATIAFLLLQPQHYDLLIRLLIVNTAPLIAHFISLTYTRITDIAFLVICSVALIITLLNLWMPSLTF
jgi:hypothetical protein